MSAIDDAIQRLQAIAMACTGLKIRGAPDYPVEDAGVLPLAIAYIADGSGQADEATTARLLLTLRIDIHVSRVSIKAAYQQLSAVIPEYLRRLAGDPTLGGAVDTIVFPVTFTVAPAEWDKVTTQMVSFTIPIKVRETPL